MSDRITKQRVRRHIVRCQPYILFRFGVSHYISGPITKRAIQYYGPHISKGDNYV